jgi:hypothetical protein
MLRLSMVLLGFAVLSWGTEYKYSLYFSPGEGRAQVLPAKLLSQKERPPQSKRTVVEATPSKSPIALDSFTSAFRATASETTFKLRMASIASQWVWPCLSIQTASLTYFAFRPPPRKVGYLAHKLD